MRRALSTRLFARQRLTTALLDRLARGGLAEIELFFDRRHLDYRNPSQLDELRHWFADSELRVGSVHAPIRNDQAGPHGGPDGLIRLVEREKAARIRATDEVKRALEFADRVPFGFFVVHLGGPGEEFHEAKIEAAFNALDELHVMARHLGVELLIENAPDDLSSADRLEYLLGVTHLPLGYCFDSGAAHRGAGVGEEFAKMEERIRLIHWHDNDGESDLRLFPEDEGGTIDWPAAMRLAAGLHTPAPWVLEPGEEIEEPAPADRALRVFERLESLAGA